MNLADCVVSATANVNVAGVGSSCEWDEDSRTCYLPEPEEDMETSLVISTISLVLTLPLEVVIAAVFAAFVVRPTEGAKYAASVSRWETHGYLGAVVTISQRSAVIETWWERGLGLHCL